ncbi:MAG: creatininase family protein [Symbiobacteriia bacterium]
MRLAEQRSSTFDLLRQNPPVAILPVGTMEAHGMHCPLGTDTLIPEHLASRAEALRPDLLLVLPPVAFGHSWDLSGFPGTLDVAAETLTAYVADIGRSLVRWGIKDIILLNGHGGNAGALGIATERIADAGGRVALVNWWLDYSKQILTVCEGQGHAGEDETATMLAVNERLVNMAEASVNWAHPIVRIRETGIGTKAFKNAVTGDYMEG